MVVLFPEAVKRQPGTAAVAKSHAIEIAREQIEARIYNPPDLDTLAALSEATLLDLSPLREVHRTLDDGTKAWLTEVERRLPPR